MLHVKFILIMISNKKRAQQYVFAAITIEINHQATVYLICQSYVSQNRSALPEKDNSYLDETTYLLLTL